MFYICMYYMAVVVNGFLQLCRKDCLDCFTNINTFRVHLLYLAYQATWKNICKRCGGRLVCCIIFQLIVFFEFCVFSTVFEHGFENRILGGILFC